MVYKMPQSAIDRKLAEVPESERPALRLRLDLGAILTGPTSLRSAEHIAESASRDPAELAKAMYWAAKRYLDATTDTLVVILEKHDRVVDQRDLDDGEDDEK